VLLSLISLIVVLLLGLVTLGPGAPTGAQEGTPTAEGFEFAPGVVAQPLAFAEGQEGPVLFRLMFAPGAILTGGDADPSIGLAVVEAGSLTVTVEAPVAVTRGGGAGTPEIVETGTEFTVEPGDYLVVPPLVNGEYRNDGQEKASLLVAAIIPSGMAPPAAGTPSA
jgi:hypothetical protein